MKAELAADLNPSSCFAQVKAELAADPANKAVLERFLEPLYEFVGSDVEKVEAHYAKIIAQINSRLSLIEQDDRASPDRISYGDFRNPRGCPG